MQQAANDQAIEGDISRMAPLNTDYRAGKPSCRWWFILQTCGPAGSLKYQRWKRRNDLWPYQYWLSGSLAAAIVCVLMHHEIYDFVLRKIIHYNLNQLPELVCQIIVHTEHIVSLGRPASVCYSVCWRCREQVAYGHVSGFGDRQWFGFSWPGYQRILRIRGSEGGKQ